MVVDGNRFFALPKSVRQDLLQREEANIDCGAAESDQNGRPLIEERVLETSRDKNAELLRTDAHLMESEPVDPEMGVYPDDFQDLSDKDLEKELQELELECQGDRRFF